MHVPAGFVNKGILFATTSQKIKSHAVGKQYNIAFVGMFITYTFYIFKNKIIFAEPQCSYCFSKF